MVNYQRKKKLSLSWEIGKKYLLEDGDILFARSGATVGKSYLFQKAMSFEKYYSFAGYLIKASVNKNNLESSFLKYYTESRCFEEWKEFIFNKATIENIGADKYSNLLVILPPLSEQAAIAAFLDDKTAKIDTAIAQKEQLIKLLQERKQIMIQEAVTKGIKFCNTERRRSRQNEAPEMGSLSEVEMKDSGVEWIGDIPAHWGVKALKHIAYLQSGDTISSESFKEEGYPVYGGNGFRGYSSNYTNDGHHCLIGRQGALCGNVNYAKGKFFASEHAIVVYPLKGENTLWLGETIKIADFNRLSQSAAQPGIAISVIKNVIFPYPPLSEQKEIAGYIEKESAKIEKAVGLQKKQIKKLREYKNTLIDSSVRGKIKVC